MSGRRGDPSASPLPTPWMRHAKLLVAFAAVVALVAACGGSGDPASQEAPQIGAQGPTSGDSTHGPTFPECGGLGNDEVSKQTRVAGLVNTAKNSVGCQWLAGGQISGPHFSFSWYRGSPIGRERKTEELTRTSVEDVNIEGHGGFIAYSEDNSSISQLGKSLCEVGIQFGDDFIEWSVNFTQRPFPDPCDVVKELTRQSIVNAK